MQNNNLLSGGVETLKEMKEALLELRNYQTKNNSLITEKDKLYKSVQSLQKYVSDEITGTTKKRRQEIENTFDDQIGKTEAHMKHTKTQRGKHKNKKVSERILVETASLRDDNDKLHTDAKLLLKQKHIPAFCNTRLFFALYFPASFGDFILILLTLMVTLMAIPCGIYFGIFNNKGSLYLILIYIATVIFFGAIYLVTGNLTKYKKQDAIRQLKEIRLNMNDNKRKMESKKKRIRKDRDESAYGLENFDEELTKLVSETADITRQKREALSTFDNSTSQVIASEIESIYKDKLLGLQEEYKKACEDSDLAEEKIKALTIKIASDYEPYIGKDLMTPERLDSLINIIQAGTAATISEAIAFQRKSMEEALNNK